MLHRHRKLHKLSTAGDQPCCVRETVSNGRKAVALTALTTVFVSALALPPAPASAAQNPDTVINLRWDEFPASYNVTFQRHFVQSLPADGYKDATDTGKFLVAALCAAPPGLFRDDSGLDQRADRVAWAAGALCGAISDATLGWIAREAVEAKNKKECLRFRFVFGIPPQVFPQVFNESRKPYCLPWANSVDTPRPQPVGPVSVPPPRPVNGPAPAPVTAPRPRPVAPPRPPAQPVFAFTWLSQGITGLHGEPIDQERLTPGQKVAAFVKVRLSGNQTVEGGRLLLGIPGDPPRPEIADGIWPGPARVATSGRTGPLRPGDTVTFRTVFTAPRAGKTFIVHLRPVIDGVSWYTAGPNVWLRFGSRPDVAPPPPPTPSYRLVAPPSYRLVAAP